MEITDIRVRKVNKEGKMKAVVSVTFDNEIVIHDIKVIEREEGLFIAMPSRRTADGEFRDVAHPINAETRNRNLFLKNMRLLLLRKKLLRKKTAQNNCLMPDSLRIRLFLLPIICLYSKNVLKKS